MVVKADSRGHIHRAVPTDPAIAPATAAKASLFHMEQT